MKYTLNSINQIGIVDAGLEKKTDVIDWLILDYIFEWKDAPKAQSLNGMVWLSYSHFIKEMPLLGIKDKGAISRRIKKLRELNLIETHQSPDDMRLYTKTTPLYYSITKFQATPTPVDLKQHPLTPINTTVDLNQHPVDENQHSTVILKNSNTKEQIKAVVAKAPKQTKAKINSDWKPGERCFELIEKAGINKNFALSLIDEFIMYWDERGDKRNGWDAAFLGHAKREFGRRPQSYSPKQQQTRPAPQYIPPEQRNGSGLVIDSTASKL